MRKKQISYICLFFFLLLGGSELYLRQAWGFCDAILIQEDAELEYIAQPNQNRHRFKHHVVYNAYSQRSEPVDSSAVIILGLGDSVLNGGTLTDQDSLATTHLSKELSVDGQRIQVLNISAGSWGPDNCMAYLNRYGTFGAVASFLVCSSHDVYDTMDFVPVVDTDVSFPSEQYNFAWYELFDRYLYPRYIQPYWNQIFSKQSEPDSEEPKYIHKGGTVFNPGFQALVDYFSLHKLPFFILLHAEISEQKQKTYNSEGAQIQDFCKNNGIPLIEDLGQLSVSDYRDNIHLNESGQYKQYLFLKEQLMKNEMICK